MINRLLATALLVLPVAQSAAAQTPANQLPQTVREAVAALDAKCRADGGKPGASPDLVKILDLTRDNLPDYVLDANNHLCPGRRSAADPRGAALTVFVGGPANSAAQVLVAPVHASRIEKFGAFDHLFVTDIADCGKPDARDIFDTQWRWCRRGVVFEASGNVTIRPRPGPSYAGADAAGRTDPSQPNYKASAGELAEAVRLWTIAADRGDVSSMLELGRAYADGKGVQQDHVRSVAYYRKVAEAGDLGQTFPGSTVSGQAMFSVGLAYENGQGVNRDEAEAANWFQRAAKAGASMQIFGLAQKFQLGSEDLERNLPKALTLYYLAAEAGYPTAMYVIASAHIFGTLGVRPDDAEAAKWLRRFASTSAAADPPMAQMIASLFAKLDIQP